YLLEAPEGSIPAFKDVWAGLGDSIVVVGSGSLWNCHIHTDDIGGAVEAALDAGRPRDIRVTDLLEQVEEERWVREAAARAAADRPDPSGPPPVTAVVAVANGEGIGRIFRSLGVSQVVTGGQSMNPSTAQILGAVEAAPARQVLVLPNNDNILPVAEQAARLSPKQVEVLPTTSIVEGFAALMEYDPEASALDNRASMAEAAARVVTGEVTRAVRSSDGPAGPIGEGDWLGLSRGRIEVVGATLSEAACALLGKLCRDDHELVTLIEGEGARAADRRRITEWLAEHRPGAVAEVHHGGQPLYPYLISIE
ncbi:MAG: DAK2 domain-containing protein, partial [Acidimicrobiales bacterium]